MKLWRAVTVRIAVILMGLLANVSFAQAAGAVTVAQTNSSPIGYWQTIDAKTHLPKSIVKLFIVQGKLYGRIMQIHYQSGHGPADVCDKCTGIRQQQPVLGMVFMWGLVADASAANHWIDGQILDPKVGSQYNSELTLVDNGQTVNVLAYKGSTLLGRTQTWQRTSLRALQTVLATQVASGSDSAAIAAMPQ